MTLRWFLKSEKYYNSFKKNFKAKPKYTLTCINKTWTFLVTARSSIFNVKLQFKVQASALGPKYTLGPNIFSPENYFRTKNSLDTENIWNPNFFSWPKTFWTKKIWSEIFCEPKNILLRNFFDSNFFSTKLFWPKIIFSL